MGFAPQFATHVESRNDVARIALGGELDLRDVTFTDSTGLSAFLQARDHAQSNGHRLTLAGTSAPARRLFEISGTQFLLDEGGVGLLDQFTGSQTRRADQTAGVDVDAV